MFSGIAGGLQVLSNEAANYVIFDPSLSAAVVLNTYIGGINVFLGPALGAALMTFFGYAVSDMTQSWMLYQGLLFVLVMMFMPTGLSGLAALAVSFAKRYGIKAVAPAAFFYTTAFFSITAAVVFLTEFIRRMLAQDYAAIANAAGASGFPAISLFGWDWSPLSVITWMVPIVLIVLGIACWKFANVSIRGVVHAHPDKNMGAIEPTPEQAVL